MHAVLRMGFTSSIENVFFGAQGFWGSAERYLWGCGGGVDERSELRLRLGPLRGWEVHDQKSTTINRSKARALLTTFKFGILIGRGGARSNPIRESKARALTTFKFGYFRAFSGSGRVRVTRPDPRDKKLLTRPNPTRPDPTREISNTSSPDPARPARF